MNIIADTHTHTIASGHAYSTLRENAESASRSGLRFLASTDHAHLLPGAPNDIFFQNTAGFPKKIAGVHILHGCEVNIADFDGSLDLPDAVLSRLEWVIASFHSQVLPPSGTSDHTRAWLAVARNPLVDVIGHCGNGDYPFEYEPIIRAFAQHKKIVEINNSSFSIRPGSKQNCRDIALLCMKYGVPVVVSSDAHSENSVGYFPASLALLSSIDFPERLILNADFKTFADVASRKSGRLFD